MELSNKSIFFKTLTVALLFGVFFWMLESIYQIFYFREDLQYMLYHEPLSIMDYLIRDIPRSSLFFRIVFMSGSITAGLIVGLLLIRNRKHDSALRESEKNYREAISAVNDGIFNFSIAENSAVLSPTCFTMLGYEPDEFPVTSEVFSNLLHPEDRRRTETIISRYITTDEPFAVEFRLKTKGGNWLWVQSRGHAAEWNQAGQPLRVTGVIANIDSRVKTQQKLRKYTNRLEEAERITKLGHWEYIYSQNYWVWSSEIYNLLQTKHSLSKLPSPLAPLKHIHPGDVRDAEKAFMLSLKNHTPFNHVHRLKLRNGLVKYVHERGLHVYNPDGSPLRSFGTIQDITETRKTEEALYDSEKRYRALFEGAGEGIIVIEKSTGQIQHANKAMCSLLGYSLDEISRIKIKNIHPEVNFQSSSSWFNIKSGDNIFINDVQCIRKDKLIFPAEVNASCIEIDGKESVVGFFNDLTENYKIEKERIMLKFAVDNSGTEIFVCNPDGSCYYANSAASVKLGYSREEFEQMNIWEVDCKLNRQLFSDMWEQLRKNKNLRSESEQTMKSGKIFPVEYTADYLTVGTSEYACLFVQDITERKKVEADLVAAKEKAEHSDQLKSLFLANMSHEIRTPMNGILGFAELMQRKDLPEEKRNEYAKIICECGNNLLQIINDILDISKIEAGEVKIIKSKFCVNKIMEELYMFFEPFVSKAEHNISFDMRKSLRDDECVILSDENRLRQIITNLLSNSIKFTHTGQIEFGYFQKDEELEFYVKDTGIGVDMEKQKTIFEPFRQAEESLSKKYRGTGLGLAIAKNYIKLLDGKIWVESELGKGSCFYFTIPFDKVEVAPKPITPASLDKTSIFNWADKKVLIVEDDRINYMLLEKLFEKTGAEIYRAETAQEAVTKGLELPDLDLILMDVRLPDFTGWEAAQKIKSVKPNIPIVVQTANAMPEDEAKTFESGCDGYISKPISRNIFYQTMERFLNK